MIKKHKLFTYCLFGSLTLLGQGSIAKAEELPVAGINLVLYDYLHSNNASVEDIKGYLPYSEKLAFAQVTNYVNIRDAAGEEGEIIGKLYNHSAATILDQTGDWYKIKSGTVTGYIKKDFLITDDKADELAKELGNRIATVTTTTLKVRDKAGTDTEVLALVPLGDEFSVIEEAEGWVKVRYDANKTGYISADYVEVRTEYEEAVSIEEELQRLEAEQVAEEAERVRLFEQRAIEAEQVRLAKQDTPKSYSSVRSNIVNYALQFLGNPYVWGGTSLTLGADCSGFTQSVFGDKGISIPRTSRAQAASGKRISINEVQPGDLIFYDKDGYINHVAIYIGDGKVISASSPKTGIRITAYNYRQPYRVVSYIND